MINKITFEQPELKFGINIYWKNEPFNNYKQRRYYLNDKLVGVIKKTSTLIDKQTWDKAYPNYKYPDEPCFYFAEFIPEKEFENVLLFFNNQYKDKRSNLEGEIDLVISRIISDKFIPIEIKLNDEKIGEILKSNYYNKYEVNLYGNIFYENCGLDELKSKIIHIINDIIL